ncbi:hypothetical protein BCD67_24675 [Oscillatoriales cyanobacterium USR001]|nr:hypothetical protein BCD67_24675 [Oscillatoriales cyanobacterium USR001]
MAATEQSLKNLVKGRKGKGAIRVNLTLKPETYEALKRSGNMSKAVDKLVEYARSRGLIAEIFLD